MDRVCVVLYSLVIAIGIAGCGGSGSGEPASTPVAPAPVPTPAPTPSPGPPTGRAHVYFESIRGRPGVIGAYSLRDQLMLDAFAHGPAVGSVDVTYDFANDTDPRKQDAAKVIVPADRVSLPNQIRLPIPPVGEDSLLVTWDAWFGREFAFSKTDIGRYKNFQFASPDTQIWTEIQAEFINTPAPFVAMVDVRQYGGAAGAGPNTTNNNPLSPQSAQFGVLPETWTRYWAFFRPAGAWFEFSLWVADETRDATLLIDRRQIKPQSDRGATGWESFWLEYNTSSVGVPPNRGALVAYARNVVMMRNADVAGLLERPVR